MVRLQDATSEASSLNTALKVAEVRVTCCPGCEWITRIEVLMHATRQQRRMALMESRAEAVKREAQHTAASASTEAEASRAMADEAKRREQDAHDQALAERRERMAAELAMHATNERIKVRLGSATAVVWDMKGLLAARTLWLGCGKGDIIVRAPCGTRGAGCTQREG